MSLDQEREVSKLARKHNLQIYPVSLPLPPLTDLSISLERLAFLTGGESFFIVDEPMKDKSSLSTYVKLSDCFREIQSRIFGTPPTLVR